MEQLSAVVVARDEADTIEGCLRRLAFAGEVIVVVDDRTTDATADLARALGAEVHLATFTAFDEFKNGAVARATRPWTLLVDADERVTDALEAEIAAAIGSAPPAAAYRIPIQNWFYGHRIRRCGYRERPIRLFRTGAGRFAGGIHERLQLDGDVGTLGHPLVHLSHRSIRQNLAKTSEYAEVQAREMLATGHPRVTGFTLARVVLGQLVRRLVLGQGVRDGTPGVIESLYQPLSMFAVYARLWELQQQPSVEERYAELERTLG